MISNYEHLLMNVCWNIFIINVAVLLVLKWIYKNSHHSK